jgi:hypothetical protein
MNFTEKVKAFANLLEKETQERMMRQYPNISPDIVEVIPGNKYVKVNVGPPSNMSGKYMIDQEGKSLGLKPMG